MSGRMRKTQTQRLSSRRASELHKQAGRRLMDEKPFEKLSSTELSMWLEQKGFSAVVQEAFEGNGQQYLHVYIVS